MRAFSPRCPSRPTENGHHCVFVSPFAVVAWPLPLAGGAGDAAVAGGGNAGVVGFPFSAAKSAVDTRSEPPALMGMRYVYERIWPSRKSSIATPSLGLSEPSFTFASTTDLTFLMR